MAVISGFAFGGVSITGRVLQFTRPYIHIVYNPLAWAIIAYGLVGILFFTIALQRASASSVNAAMICAETILPICIGLIFLGDHPKDHLWALLILGIILTALGALFIARTDKLPKKYLNDAAKR
jgi:drug/metabolite transporter (DMT)-like permease